ncbi:MAG: PSD1 and planctomycete cytochrome C domain-containing protein [Pirellulales bacterium]
MLIAVWMFVAAGPVVAATDADAVDFTRDVRPILADKCFRCHGPDPESRQADLRLDMWESTDDLLGAVETVVPGEPDQSELVARITAEDAEERMPPVDSGKSLKPEQIETLKQWIAQGAEYKQHWSFVPPERPAVPKVSNPAWVRNPIDAFVLARLDTAGLQPSPPAEPIVLLRRLSLDLIGLPPTLEEIEAFQANVASHGRDEAYRREVERLLASPHYGERWGRVWLDAARYADSDGYEKDKPRDVWMYRDWVVKALNDDMPYDRFLVDQIAGDVLPGAKQSDLIATGFLRNSMTNAEGGIDPEQFRMEAMFDRMDAIGKAVLGLTVQCAQCHTHKYDPLTHTEYYQLFAFLNNCHEKQITVYTDADEARRQQLLGEIRRIEDEVKASNPDWQERMAAWEASVRDGHLNWQPKWTVVRPTLDTSGGQKHFVLEDGSILAAGYAPSQFTSEFPVDVKGSKIAAVRLELLNDPSLPLGGPGRSVYGLCALSEMRATIAPLDHPEQTTDVKFKSVSADVNPAELEVDKQLFGDNDGTRRVTGPSAFAIDGSDTTAWGIDVGPGRSNVPRKAVFVLDQPIDATDGIRITFKLAQMHGEHYEIGTYDQNLGRFRFAVTSVDSVKADPMPSDVRESLAVPAADRTPAQSAAVFSYWRTTVPAWQEANARIESLWQQHPRGSSQLVVGEREVPRATHRLDRGNFLAPAEEVAPGVPAFLHPLAEGEPPNRLALAHWLADRRSPTTARAMVNRLWQAYFGVGLVMTAEDLGTQGEPPAHPELLDWLAVEFMDHGWSLKHIHELIVSSATYQQSSTMRPEQIARDPDNRLLERGPRFRVDAEVVRDVALAVSGLLNLEMGGPSVFPPAPEFLFKPPTSYALKRWNYDTGSQKYRRALYTFRFRSVPYPVLQNFDAPTGDVSCPRRGRSNTPLQALTTLNEALFVECARSLAARVVTEGGASDSERMTYAVRRCLAREPQEAELAVLQEFMDQQREHFTSKSADPWPLISDVTPPKDSAAVANLPGNTTPAELAAWTALARVVLNLDETITKE